MSSAGALSPDGRLPVSLLCGFLGAGKTTLLKHILEAKHSAEDFKCAVIVNDMAALNIDKSLIDQSAVLQSDEVIAMQNGCLCCTLQSDLVEQIIALARKKAFTYMLIEASGVSEPSHIAPLFELCDDDHDHEEAHGGRVALGELARLDTCVTVVDSAEFYNNLASVELGESENFRGTIAELMMEQVEFSNVVVLNKEDLVSAEQLRNIEDRVSLLNPRAKVLTARHSRIDVKEISDTGLFSMEGMNNSVMISAMKAEPTAPMGASDPCGETLRLDSTAPKQASKPCCEKSLAETGAPCCGASKPCGETSPAESTAPREASKPCCEKSLAETGAPCCGASKPRNGEIIETSLSQVLLGVIPTVSRHEARFGITSFVYRARRPFHPRRLHEGVIAPYFILHGEGAADVAERQREAAAKQAKRGALMGELLRSKGFLWLATSHDIMGGWSQAGNVVTVQAECAWLCDMRELWEGTPSEASVRKDLTNSAGEEYPYGDRRQELVFIGMGLSHTAIQSTLDRCLLTDEEMDMGPASWEDGMAAGDPIKLCFPVEAEEEYGDGRMMGATT